MKAFLMFLVSLLLVILPFRQGWAQNPVWQHNTDTSAVNDEIATSTYANAVQGVSSFGRPFTLMINCQGSQLKLVVVWWNVISIEPIAVTWRVDSTVAQTDNWNGSDGGQATFFRGDVRQLVNDLSSARRFVVQVRPLYSEPLTAIFDVSGLKTAVQPVLAACHN